MLPHITQEGTRNCNSHRAESLSTLQDGGGAKKICRRVRTRVKFALNYCQTIARSITVIRPQFPSFLLRRSPNFENNRRRRAQIQ